MVALRQHDQRPAPAIKSAKLVILSERRKIYSKVEVAAMLDAETAISTREREAARHKQTVILKPKREGWQLGIVPQGKQFRFEFWADAPRQKTNPEVLTRNEAQRFLALRRVQLE